MKKIINVFLVLCMCLTTLALPINASAETTYIDSFKSSDAFSTTTNQGPWYYYMQQSNTNALSRMLGSASGIINATDILDGAFVDSKTITARVGTGTVDTNVLVPAGAMPNVPSDFANFGYVGATTMSPEERWNWYSPDLTIQTMKAFEVPYDCEAVISADTGVLTGMVSRNNKAYGDRRVRIMLNNPSNEASNVAENKIWPADKDWQQIDGVESFTFEDLAPMSFKKGDMLFFIVDNNGTRHNDDLMWDPVVNIVEKDELVTLINDNFDNNTTPNIMQVPQGFTIEDGVAKATGVDCQLIYGNSGWSEYKIDVDVVSHNSASILWKVRRTDNANNYNFVLSPTGALNFRKSVAGTTTTVPTGNFETDAFPYRGNVIPAEIGAYPSMPYKLSVYVCDNLVRVYINDAMVLSYHDENNSNPLGDIVVGCYGANSGIVYDNIRISAKQVLPTISEIKLTDGDNVEITDIADVTTLRATSTVLNDFCEPSRYMMVIAVYDEFDNMIGINCGKPNGTKNAGVVWTNSVGSEYTVTLDYDVSAIEGKSYAKAYLWYDLNEIRPQQYSSSTK